jgi:hypothetical protein
MNSLLPVKMEESQFGTFHCCRNAENGRTSVQLESVRQATIGQLDMDSFCMTLYLPVLHIKRVRRNHIP